MDDGRSLPPTHHDVPPRPSAPQRRAFGGDGRVRKVSAFQANTEALKGIPNAIRRDHRRLQQTLQSQDSNQPDMSDWMAVAQHDQAYRDGTIEFPAPRQDSGPGYDYLGRPIRRRSSRDLG